MGSGPAISGTVCSGAPSSEMAPTPSLPIPTRPQAENRPPIRKTHASGSAGAPKDGARPPGAGGVGGASGERLGPSERGEPGKLFPALSGFSCWALANAGVSAHAAASHTGSQPLGLLTL